MRNALQALLATLPSPALLVLGTDVDPGDVAEPPDGAVLSLRDVLKDPSVRQPRGWRTVLWLTRDRASLRQDAAIVPRVGQCRTAGVWLLGSDVPVVVQPRGEWPALVGQRAEAGEHGAVTVVRLAAPLGAHSVLGELARQAVPGADRAHGGVVVGYAGRRPAPGVDLRAPLAATVAGLTGQERDVPPDVVLAGPDASAASGGAPAEHHVTGRRPLVLTDRDGGAWAEPVDELVYHPRGWRKDWDAPVVDLGELLAKARRGGVPVPAAGRPQVTEDVVRAARAHQGVRLGVAGPAAAHPQDLARLAMAGVPLLLDAPGPADAGPGAALPPALAEALARPVDLEDSLSREEHSVRTRRAAFDTCSTLVWRAGLARRAGVRWAHGAEQALPTVSVLLATKRPHQLEFALRQVARQRGVRVELVLATHGFTVAEERVRQVLAGAAPEGAAQVPVTLVPCDADAWFGDVLSAAAQAASGDLLMKMDDDDWYSADAVHDLVMARRYAGADVVGMPSEFVYLEAADVTVRRNHPTEQFARFIAGGTILLDRGLLHSLGLFRRVRRYVDAQLLSGVEAAGGRIYRTHGLGYVLRRSAAGHTWDMDDETFRRPEIVDREWPGFRTSSELVSDRRDLPGGTDA